LIIGVAIKHKDKIYRLPKPYKHIDLIIYLRENTPNKDFDIKGKNRTYLNRQKAMIYVKTISNQCPENLINKTTLFSEDLW